MKLIPISFIQGRRYDVRFKNGEDSLFMFLISDKIHKVSFTSKNAVYYRRYRNGNATMSRKSIFAIIKNQLKMIREYSLMFLRHSFEYSLNFYLTRIIGAIRSILHR